MSKLYSAFSNSFAQAKPSLNALYDYALDIPSLNGLYLAVDSSIDKSQVALNNQGTVSTWYDLSGSTNYLYSESASSAPSFTSNDPLLNNQPSIDFGEIGNKQLLFKNSVRAKTVVIVYYLRQHRSYLLYCPGNTPPPDPLFFDYMPSYGTSIWSSCNQTNNLAFNSTNRINTRDVPSTTYLPLNSSRILSTQNLGGNGQYVSITGIGGRKGLPNGGSATGGITDSVKGSIAAILTFSEQLDTATLLQLELLLKDMYINYSGPSVTSLRPFKYLLNSSVSFDFSSITVDEWSSISSYEILSPSTLNLSFNGPVLEGIASSIYNGKLRIRITNTFNIQNTFEFPFEVVRADPLVGLLPGADSLHLVLSSAYNLTDLERYGVYTDNNQQVMQWEDARRITSGAKYLTPSSTTGTYEAIAPASILFNQSDSYQLSTAVDGRTFLWVYKQDSYGIRPLLEGLPDRRGNGSLWTTATASQLHGQTTVTKLNAEVNKVPVNTLTFRTKLDKLYFITAVQPDNEVISITGLRNLRGRLYFLAVWDRKLTVTELHAAIALLADRYVPSQGPFIANNDREYRYSSDVVIDLRTKVVDLKNRSLTYTIVQNNRNAVIVNHLLTFTAVTDELLEFKIDVTNTDNETTQLIFEVDVVLRTNPLYLTFKAYLATLDAAPSITDIYLATNDTLVRDINNNLVQWLDYRLNTKYGTVYGTSISTLPLLKNKPALNFNTAGSSYIDLHSSITSSDWLVVYIKPEEVEGNLFLLGNDTAALFGGTVDELHTSSLSSNPVLSGSKYINKRNASNSDALPTNVINIIYWHTAQPVTVDSIAKDRLFTTSSVKGYIPLVMSLSSELSPREIAITDSIIRDYYDPVRFVCLLHFNNNLIDSSIESKVLTGNAQFVTTSKFGSHALNLKTSSIVIANNSTFAWLSESFTISFQLLVNQQLLSNSTLYLYRQTGLAIYIKGDSIYIDTDTSSSTYLLAYALPTSFYASQITSSQYRHIELNRIYDLDSLSSRYELYIDGLKVREIEDQSVFKDVNTNVQIGGITGNLPANLVVYMDELAMFRRGYLHDTNFISPGSEYVI